MVRLRFVLVVFVTHLCALTLSSAQGSITPRLQEALTQSTPGSQVLCLVVFKDKPAGSLLKTIQPSSLVTPRALLRRANVLPADRLIDDSDLPVSEQYVEAVAASGATIRHTLKWFNAVSVLA
ncbi:MAG: hypothetical protein WB699_04560, partial [Bacteroidota bacterium]